MKSQILNIKNCIALLIGLTGGLSSFAQQTPLSNFYNFNQLLLSPAEAGSNTVFEGVGSHRIQWQGIEGAPTTTFLGLHGALNEKMGIGGRIVMDQTDLLRQLNASFSYAYRIKLNDEANLSFGVAAMMVQNSIAYSEAVVGDYADEVINGSDQDGMAFDAEAGVMLDYKRLRLGIASSHLFESGVNYDLPDGSGSSTYERVRQFRVYSSYLFDLSENWDLEPFVLLRNQGVESMQYEINSMTSWKQTLFLGAGYRNQAGMIARAGFQLTDQLLAAYAYEFSNSGVASYSSGTHEFMIRYRISNKKAEKAEVKNKDIIEKSTSEILVAPVDEPAEEEPSPKITDVVKAAPVEEKVEPAPKPTPAPKSTTAAKVKLDPVTQEAFDKNIAFEFESSNAKLENNASLDKVASFLNNNPDVRVRIEGHTCNMGTDEVNTRYSLKRANSVKDYLLNKGVKPGQMEVKAMLDKEPLVPNTSIANRQKNRRVEIEIID